jgi:uncharacterized metal-binding protein YceD (DUF177 family)
MRRVHKDGDCNEEQLKMLENLHHTKHEDARWDALKNLKKDSN